MQFLKLAFFTLLSQNVRAKEEEEDVIAVKEPVVIVHEFTKSSIKAPFLEQFTSETWERWVPSQSKKVVDGVEDEELLAYRGQWGLEEGEGALVKGDTGLLLKTMAAHSAIAATFKKPVDPKGKGLVVQYEVKFLKGLVCGGAYLKLITFDPEFKAKMFGDKTPYTIMFGPDVCGGDNKVHFIFRHKSPKTGVIEEKHLKSPPASGVETKKTSLYTLIVRPDNTFSVKVNNEEVSKGSLLEDFNPSVNPPKEIDDPEDKKPADWVDQDKIPDSEATKPEDWDEDAPREIIDESATIPEDWLVDEPSTVPDPNVTKPEDWDDEEDGDWTAPVIANPKCEQVSGCGKWERPMIANPAYKGKWSAPMIDNPEYKGVWAPRKIANPDYFEDKSPSDFTKIGAVGFELWSMQDGFLFDNIYIGHSEADAKALAEETWVIKHKLEKEAEPKPEEGAAAGEGVVAAAKGYVAKAVEFAGNVQKSVNEFLALAQGDFVGAVKELPHIAGLLIVAAVLPLLFITSLFSSSPSSGHAVASKKAASPKKGEKSEKAEKKTSVGGEAVATGVESKEATKRAAKE